MTATAALALCLGATVWLAVAPDHSRSQFWAAVVTLASFWVVPLALIL